MFVRHKYTLHGKSSISQTSRQNLFSISKFEKAKPQTSLGSTAVYNTAANGSEGVDYENAFYKSPVLFIVQKRKIQKSTFKCKYQNATEKKTIPFIVVVIVINIFTQLPLGTINYYKYQRKQTNISC